MSEREKKELIVAAAEIRARTHLSFISKQRAKLNLSEKSYNCLRRYIHGSVSDIGYFEFDDLSRSKLFGMPQVGEVTYNEIISFLKENGFDTKS